MDLDAAARSGAGEEPDAAGWIPPGAMPATVHDYQDTVERQRRGRPADERSGRRACGGYIVWKFDLLPGEEKVVRILGDHPAGRVTAKPFYSPHATSVEWTARP